MVFQEVMSSLWQIMNIPITLYGFTLTMGEIYIFSIILGFVVYAVFKILWG